MESPLTASALADRLKAKTEQDRIQIENLVQDELRRLSENLRQQSNAALSSTEAAITQKAEALSQNIEAILSTHQVNVEEMKAHLTWGWIKPILIGASLCLGISGGSWGLMQLFSRGIQNQLETREALAKEIDQQREILADLAQRGGKIKLSNCPDGQKKRLCAQINESAPTYQNGYRILNGY